MASYGAIQRPTAATRSDSPLDSSNPRASTAGTNWSNFKRAEFKLVCPFNIPSSPEAAALRIIKNLSHFALYYTHFVWIILFISLIPKRKLSLILLVIMTYVGSLFLLLLRAVPSSNIVHKILDKRVVLPLIFVATVVQLVVTDAGLHLLVTLAGSLPVVLVHAVLWVREDFSVEEEGYVGGGRGSGGDGASGELLPLVQESSSTV